MGDVCFFTKKKVEMELHGKGEKGEEDGTSFPPFRTRREAEREEEEEEARTTAATAKSTRRKEGRRRKGYYACKARLEYVAWPGEKTVKCCTSLSLSLFLLLPPTALHSSLSSFLLRFRRCEPRASFEYCT